MKKQQIYLLLAFLIMVLAMPLINQLSKGSTNKPFAGLKAEEVKNIDLNVQMTEHAQAADERLVIEDENNIKTVVEILNTMTVSSYKEEKLDYNGQVVTYKLNKNGGKSVEISICSPYVIIDEKIYKTDYAVCDVLNLFGNDLLGKNKQ